MVEKQALEGVLIPVSEQWHVPFSANKGYSSSSALYRAGKRIERALKAGKNIRIIYLGDHDPSGIDMTRDVEDRLKMYSGYRFWAPKDDSEKGRAKALESMNPRLFERYRNAAYSDQIFEVHRAALNMDQIEEYNPPPNPAKMTDSRARDYVEKFGDESWELDALDPEVLAQTVTDAIEEILDREAWEKRESDEENGRGYLEDNAARYEDENE
jgi:hypothetical protein